MERDTLALVFASVVMGLPGLMFGIGALWGACQRLALYTRGRRATATVLARRDTEEQFRMSHTRTVAVERGRVRIRFTDENGETHTVLYPDNSQRGRTFSVTASGVSEDLRVGDEVTVLYLPDDPRFCFLDRFPDVWGPVLASAAGAAAFLAPLALLCWLLG